MKAISKTIKEIHALIKVGTEEHMKALYSKGEIHMKNLNYFKKLESNDGRGDKYEGAFSIEQVTWIRFEFGGKTIEWGKKDGKLKKSNVITHAKVNELLYSLISLSNEDVNIKEPIDERNESFGDTFVFIHDVPAFLNKIEGWLVANGYGFNRGLVQYYDEDKHAGELGPFDKPAKLDYQKEFRFVVYADKKNQEALTFQIGSLEEVALIFPIRVLNSIKLSISNSL